MFNSATLLWTKFRSLLLQIKTNFPHKWLEISVSFLIISGLVVGGYALFARGAFFLLAQGELGQLLLDRIFYLGWSIIFYLLILSNIVTAFSTLYRSPEVSFLMTMPLSYLNVFRIKFVENLVYSSWAILILGLPLALAYGKAKSLSAADMLVVLFLGLLPYLVIATAVSLGLIMLVIRLSRWFRMRSIFLVLGIIFIALFWIYFKYGQRETILMGDMASFRVINRYLINLSRNPFPLIPSFWLSELFTSYSQNDWANLTFYAGLCLSTALVGVEISDLVAKHNYFVTFQMMEGSENSKQGQAPVTSSEHSPETSSGRLRWLSPQMRGLVTKDVLQFARTPQQWIQFLLLGFFIAIYLINLSRADVRLATLSPFWQTVIYLLNFGFSGFILAALTARFVFPLISLEGEALWVLKSSPLQAAELFKEKFWLSFVIFFGLAETVALVSNYYLSQDLYLSLVSMTFLALMTFSLISISLGLGAVFPQFHERNPTKISSGAGGIITVIVSLFYVGAMVGTLVWILTIMEGATLDSLEKTQKLVPIFLGTLLLNALCVYLPLKWGQKSLTCAEL